MSILHITKGNVLVDIMTKEELADSVVELNENLRIVVSALKPFANIDVDFIAKDEPIRHLILKAREALEKLK